MLESRLNNWLVAAIKENASDLHIIPDSPPIIRLHGELHQLPFESLLPSETTEILKDICPPKFKERLKDNRNLDFAFEFADGEETYRTRVNFFYSGENLGGCFRFIPNKIPDFGWANFPDELASHLTSYRNGLVLFSGVTGSGKTTSLAMMIQSFINLGGFRIVTIEDPIEYAFESNANAEKSSVITQRQVNRDVASFAEGLRYGLRQDPDIILVGEIRDRETAQIALSAAETGHLVFSTVHTRDAKGAISRFSDLFEANMQNEIRSQLALSLRAVISQHLLPSNVAGGKRELAMEVMLNNSAIASSIRLGRLETIDNAIQMSGKSGMYSLDESIRRLLRENRISRETAELYANDVTHLSR